MMMMIHSQEEVSHHHQQSHNQTKPINTTNQTVVSSNPPHHHHHHHPPNQMSVSSQPPHHHHHFYHPDPATAHYHHHHVHQQQQQHYHQGTVEYPSPTPDAHGSLSSSSTMSSTPKRCCQSCRCSNRLVTGIIITILPIAITSTLICVFMMQKTNLHQYAIYSFVIFCVAFVFPFALFFFTVVINKLYKFYKREILATSPHTNHVMMASGGDGGCDSEAPVPTGYSLAAPGSQLSRVLVTDGHPHDLEHHLHHQHHHHHHHSSPPVMPQQQSHQHPPVATAHQQSTSSPGLICSATGSNTARAYHHQGGPYYYQIQDGTVVAIAAGPGDNATAYIIEDSPPSYEMALLCPSVVTQDPGCPPLPASALPSSQNVGAMQVILPPKEQAASKEKVVTTTSVSATVGTTVEAPETTDPTPGEDEADDDDDQKDPGEESTTSGAETSSSSGSGTKEEPVSHQTSQEEI